MICDTLEVGRATGDIVQVNEVIQELWLLTRTSKIKHDKMLE